MRDALINGDDGTSLGTGLTLCPFKIIAAHSPLGPMTHLASMVPGTGWLLLNLAVPWPLFTCRISTEACSCYSQGKSL